MDDIDKLDEGMIIILYSVPDFQPGSSNSIEQMDEILDTLKKSKKYEFMTLKAYQETHPKSNQALTSSDNTEARIYPKMLGWNLYLGLIALLVIRRYIIESR